MNTTSIKVTMMSVDEIARYESIRRRFDAREKYTREEFDWMIWNLTRYEVTITATQTSPP